MGQGDSSPHKHVRRTAAAVLALFPSTRLVNTCGLLISFFFFNDTAPTEIYTLSLHYALPISNPKVTVNVTYLVGSRHEGYGETGMAHLLEHLDFIETTNGRKVKEELVAHGANWNGTTSEDRTNYYETVSAS